MPHRWLCLLFLCLFIILLFITKKAINFLFKLSASVPHCFFSFLYSDIDDCAGKPCQNDGNCTDEVNDFYCDCVAGYSGKNCSIGEIYFVK